MVDTVLVADAGEDVVERPHQAAVRGTDREIDIPPVVKFFTPDAGATWL